jgi:hypothetical protein
MSEVVEIQIYKRGYIEWIFVILFWIFNALMAIWALATFFLRNAPHTGEEGAYGVFESVITAIGSAIGDAIGGTFNLSDWASGSVILAALIFVTRSRKTIVTAP